MSKTPANDSDEIQNRGNTKSSNLGGQGERIGEKTFQAEIQGEQGSKVNKQGEDEWESRNKLQVWRKRNPQILEAHKAGKVVLSEGEGGGELPSRQSKAQAYAPPACSPLSAAGERQSTIPQLSYRDAVSTKTTDPQTNPPGESYAGQRSRNLVPLFKDTGGTHRQTQGEGKKASKERTTRKSEGMLPQEAPPALSHAEELETPTPPLQIEPHSGEGKIIISETSDTQEGPKEPEEPKGESKATKPTFCFGAAGEGAHSKRGYRSSELSLNFWKSFDLFPPSVAGNSKLEIIPLLIRKRDPASEEPKHEFLLDRLSKLNTAVMRIQVTAHDTGQWNLSKARDLVVNETALALNRMLKSNKENPPPITKWNDASWHLKWVKGKNQEAAGCIWFAVTEVQEGTTIRFQKPGKQVWVNLSEELESLVKYREDGEMELLPDDFCPQIMDLPHATQAFPPSPLKPAMKKNKHGYMESGSTSNSKEQEEDNEKSQSAMQGTEGLGAQREDKAIIPAEIESRDESN